MYSIYPGRFQPFHLGHEHILREAIQAFGEGGGGYVVGVIVNNVASDRDPLAAPRIGDERQTSGLNPFSVFDRVRMITAALQQSPLSIAVALPLPRPTLYWEVIEAMFPGQRRWILPETDDPFELQKATHYRRKGDLVHLVAPRADIAGTAVRALLAKNDPKLAQMLSGPTYEYIAALRQRTRD